MYRDAEPKYNRFGIRTKIYCINRTQIPTIPIQMVFDYEDAEEYVLEKIETLKTIEEKHTFFKRNEDNVVNFIDENIITWNTSIDNFIKDSIVNMGVAGNRIILQENDELVIYKIIGFYKSNGCREIYFNIK